MRKYTALFLALVCIFALCGCGQDPQNADAAVTGGSMTETDNFAPISSHPSETVNSDIGTEKPAASTSDAYTYEELSQMPAEELLDLFIRNGLVINDDLKTSFTEEELQTLFKQNFNLWCKGMSVYSWTVFFDLAEQTKAIYDKIAE